MMTCSHKAGCSFLFICISESRACASLDIGCSIYAWRLQHYISFVSAERLLLKQLLASVKVISFKEHVAGVKLLLELQKVLAQELVGEE